MASFGNQTQKNKSVTIEFDGTRRGYELASNVSEVKITGVNGKNIYFARGNFNAGEIGTDVGVIPKEELSYISYSSGKINSSRNVQLSDSEDFTELHSSINIPENLKNDSRSVRGDVEDKPVLTQKTKDDFVPGETKRNFICYNGKEGIIRTFTALAVRDNVIVWRDDTEGSTTTEKITKQMCESIADNFEKVLPYETEFLGNKSTELFLDKENTIKDVLKKYSDLANFTNILIFDILNVLSSENIDGFFDSDDYYSKDVKECSNQGTFIYLNYTSILSDDWGKNDVGVTYTTFSTICNIYARALRGARRYFDNGFTTVNSALEDLLGQFCEYTLYKQMGIPNPESIIINFYWLYNNYCFSGLMDSNAYYAAHAGLSVFLFKNYGGMALLKEMFNGADDGWDAILNGINRVTGKSVTKSELLLHFMEAYSCKGSVYSENLKKKTIFTVNGEKLEVEGLNPFNLAEGGYFEPSERGWEKKGFSLLGAGKDDRIDLRPEGGFHICDAGTAEEDTVTLKIALGTNPAEVRYILISD